MRGDARETGYAFSNHWAQARRRLNLLEAWYDPTTIGRLQAVAVGASWQCLEAGAGTGSIARWLCEQTGPEGRVVAVDVEPELLADLAPRPNLTIRQVDIVGDALPEAEFDLVHARAVLMHLPERERVIQRLVTCLKPGGTLVLEEGDVHPVVSMASGPYRDAMMAMSRDLGRLGLALDWARTLPALLADLGLEGVGGDCWCPWFPGGSSMALFWELTWSEAMEASAGEALDAPLVARASDAVNDTGTWFPGLAMVGAWGRRRNRSGDG